MDDAHADALAARRHLESQGWIARNAEHFRHQPPPPVEAWLGDDTTAAARDAPAGAGWTLLPIGEASHGSVHARWLDAADPAQRAELLAGLPAPDAPVDGAADDAAPFAWAHRALCRQGLRLTIGATPAGEHGGPRVVSLALRHRPRSAVEAPLLVLDLAAGVHCVLVETHEHEAAAGSQPIVQNLQIHVRLAEGATLQHLRSVAPQPGDRIAHHLHLRAERGARFEQATIAAGSQYQLHRHLLELQGPGAVGRSAALLFADVGAVEQQLRVAHQAGGTTSAVEMLALASGSARAVLNARARIAPGAAEANVHQRLSGIPTGGQPKLVLRPHLEILHDQVQATHGATWGALPEEEIFYARQRGLDERTARHLIVEGMTQALLQRCFSGDTALHALGAEPLLHAAVARHLNAAEEGDRG